MSIFTKAKHLFDQGEYAKALNLYKSAGESYGWEIVQYHVERCEDALDYSNKQGKGIGREYAEVEFTSKLLFNENDCPEAVNDFAWYKAYQNKVVESTPALSIVIPTFNRAKLLSITLASLAIQRTNYDFEVIVADDGSSENIIAVVRGFESKLDLKYVRQQDKGYQLCAIRNLGLRASKYPYVAILDCDMAPDESWVQSYTEALMDNEWIAYIGPRKYIDTSEVSCDDIIAKRTRLSEFAEIPAKKELGRVSANGVSKDWRLEHFEQTDSLRLSQFPFRFFSCGNVAFAKKWLTKVGWFDEDFKDWGGEDNEFGYRLFKAGCFFKSLEGAMAFHQEPPGAENETDRNAGKKVTSELVVHKVPVFYRKKHPIEDAILFETSLVLIIVTGRHTISSIESLVNSILNQSIVDLRVQISNEQLSSDVMAFVKKKYYRNPRIKVIEESHKIDEPFNIERQISSSNSYYIGLITDKYALPRNAIEITLGLLSKSKDLNCVMATDIISGKPVLKMFSSRAYSILKNVDKLACSLPLN